jgi:type II secretory pathway pseudopilin PulG
VTSTTRPSIDLKRSKLRRRAAGIASLVILIALVAAAAFGLSQWRSSEHEDAKAAFAERSRAVAAQVESLFIGPRPNFVAGIGQAADDGNLQPRDLLQVAGNFGQAWALDPTGKVIARSPGTQGRPRSPVALATGDPQVSSVLPSEGAGIELGIPIDATREVAIVVVRYPAQFISSYIGDALDPIPTNSDLGIFVVDDRGRLLAGHGPAAGRGSEIIGAVGAKESGEFEIDGEEVLFSQSDVHDAPWTVVLAAPKTEVFETAGGPAGWVPWAALGVVQRGPRAARA